MGTNTLLAQREVQSVEDRKLAIAFT